MEQQNGTPTIIGDQKRVQMEREIDPIKLNELRERMKEEQNPIMGILSGLLAAIIGAVIWAAITVITTYQIGWMAIGVAFLVGWSVRRWGRGVDKYFGIFGAALALFGCLLGNILTIAAIVSREEAVNLFSVLGLLILNPGSTFEILKETFSVTDLLFYGFAVYYGYKYSFRTVTKEEAEQLYKK